MGTIREGFGVSESRSSEADVSHVLGTKTDRIVFEYHKGKSDFFEAKVVKTASVENGLYYTIRLMKCSYGDLITLAGGVHKQPCRTVLFSKAGRSVIGTLLGWSFVESGKGNIDLSVRF